MSIFDHSRYAFCGPWADCADHRPGRFVAIGVPGEEKFLRKGTFYGNIQELSFVEGEDVAVIGGGNSALQVVENLHTVARKTHLISTSELTADAAVVDRVRCLPNFHAYLNYKVLEFTGGETLTGVTIRGQGFRCQEAPPNLPALAVPKQYQYSFRNGRIRRVIDGCSPRPGKR